MDSTLPSTPAVYPELPADVETSKRHYILGWKVSEDWLKEFGKWYDHSNRTTENTFGCCALGVSQLRLRSGFSSLHHFYVIREGEPIPDVKSDSEQAYERVLAVSFTASLYLYYHRPTQAQFDWLCKVLGGEPRWYRDTMPKECFYQYNLPTSIELYQ